MRRLIASCVAAFVLSACTPKFEFDAGFEFPHLDAGTDDGGCGERFMPTADSVLEAPSGSEGVQQPTCLLPGVTYTVTFPPMEIVELRLAGDGRSTFTLQRGAETLLQGPLTGTERSGWFFAGLTNPVTLTLHANADAGLATDSVITWSRTGYPQGSVALGETNADGGFNEYVSSGATPATAPLLPPSTGGLRFSVAESALRLADTPGCEHPTATGWSYYALTLDAGTHHFSNINNLITFETVVFGADGGVLASGVLDPSYDVTPAEEQRVVFGWSGLDGGLTSTCAFDGGQPPDAAYFVQEFVYVQ